MDIGPGFGNAVGAFLQWFVTIGGYVMNALLVGHSARLTAPLSPQAIGYDATMNAIAVCAHGFMWFAGDVMQAIVCGQMLPKSLLMVNPGY